MLKQSQSVLHYTQQVLGSSFQEGLDVRTYCSDSQRSKIVDLVTESILSGETFMKEDSRRKYSTHESLRRYVVGMVKNWFDKSKKLNGGIKHQAKSPGVRRFNKDEVIQNLRIMRKQLEESGNLTALAEIDEAIAARIAELQASSKNGSTSAA